MESATALSEADLDELNCPLCGYDLRGLPEQRCPECGHAFDPDELRRAKSEKRQWFFEHAQRRMMRSFILTTLRALWPPDLWRRIGAAHEFNRRRLKLWAGIWVAVSVAILGVLLALSVYRYTQIPGALSGFQLGYASAPLSAWIEAIRQTTTHGNYSSVLRVMTLVTVWPGIALAALSIFGATLQRANIHAEHLSRCVVYAMPLSLLPTYAIVTVALIYPNDTSWYPGSSFERLLGQLGLPLPATIALATAAILSTFHLAVSHVKYLRVPHALGQALLVQAVSWLFVFVVIAIVATLRL